MVSENVVMSIPSGSTSYHSRIGRGGTGSGEDRPDMQPPSRQTLCHAILLLLRDARAGLVDDLGPISWYPPAISAVISADELPTISSPWAIMGSLNAPSATALRTSCVNRSSTSCGVFAGATMPNQPVSS